MAQKQVHGFCPTENSTQGKNPEIPRQDPAQPPPGLSLADAVKGFLRYQKHLGRRPGTIIAQGTTLGQLAAYAQQQEWPPVAEIGKDHIREYMEFLLDRPRWFGERTTQAGISPGYHDTIFRRFRRFFNFLVEDGKMAVSPIVPKERPRIPEKIVPIVEHDEVERLLAITNPKAGRNDRERFYMTRDHAAFYFFVDTSARRSGFAHVKVADIDLEEGRILVTEKGDKQRYLSLGYNGIKALRAYLVLRAQRHPRTDNLWVDQNGRAMEPDWIRRMMYRRAAKAEVIGLHPHRFRHTFITRAIEADINQTMIEGMCGVTKVPKTYLNKIGWKQIQAAHLRFSPGDAVGRSRGERR